MRDSEWSGELAYSDAQTICWMEHVEKTDQSNPTLINVEDNLTHVPHAP